MNFTTGLIIGLIVGWLVEWIIDWLFWRRRNERLREELVAAKAQIADLEAKLAAISSVPSRVIIKEKDRLERIHGIGSVFTRRFNEAGIHTFADLAALTPERAREIIAPEDWQATDPDSWVAQAKQFTQEKSHDTHSQ